MSTAIAPFDSDYPSVTLPTIVALAGFLLGVQKGAQGAAMQYRAQYHHIPKTTKQWYFYHSKKQSVAIVGGVKVGFQYAFKFAAITMIWEGARWGIQLHLDSYRIRTIPKPPPQDTSTLMKQSVQDLNNRLSNKVMEWSLGAQASDNNIASIMQSASKFKDHQYIQKITSGYIHLVQGLPKWSEGMVSGSGGGIISAAAICLSCKIMLIY
jgi:hypothetical protein